MGTTAVRFCSKGGRWAQLRIKQGDLGIYRQGTAESGAGRGWNITGKVGSFFAKLTNRVLAEGRPGCSGIPWGHGVEDYGGDQISRVGDFDKM